MQSKISNLTCVLTQMKILDANMQPNMYQYLTGVWQELDMSEPNIAIQEPEWVQKMKNSYTDCHDLAKAWPQKSLDRNELTKKYGREMVFFKCVDVSTSSYLYLICGTYNNKEQDCNVRIYSVVIFGCP